MSWVSRQIVNLLAFLNLLEPRRNAISLTKLGVWAAIVTLNVSVFRSPATYGIAVTALATVLANYAHRYGRRPPEDNQDQQNPMPRPAPPQTVDVTNLNVTEDTPAPASQPDDDVIPTPGV